MHLLAELRRKMRGMVLDQALALEDPAGAAEERIQRYVNYMELD